MTSVSIGWPKWDELEVLPCFALFEINAFGLSLATIEEKIGSIRNLAEGTIKGSPRPKRIFHMSDQFYFNTRYYFDTLDNFDE